MISGAVVGDDDTCAAFTSGIGGTLESVCEVDLLADLPVMPAQERRRFFFSAGTEDDLVVAGGGATEAGGSSAGELLSAEFKDEGNREASNSVSVARLCADLPLMLVHERRCFSFPSAITAEGSRNGASVVDKMPVVGSFTNENGRCGCGRRACNGALLICVCIVRFSANLALILVQDNRFFSLLLADVETALELVAEGYPIVNGCIDGTAGRVKSVSEVCLPTEIGATFAHDPRLLMRSWCVDCILSAASTERVLGGPVSLRRAAYLASSIGTSCGPKG